MRCALLVGPVPARGEPGPVVARGEEALIGAGASMVTGEVLSSHEKALLGPRAVPKRREDFLRGRWIAKRLLVAARPASEPLDYVILPDAFGAPVVHDRSLRPLPFSISISHTEGLAMAALCDGPGRVGVDVERPIGRPESILREYFTQEEVQLCAGLQGEALQSRAALIWSVKEALMKLIGQGLRITPTSVGLLAKGEASGDWSGATVFLRGSDVDESLAPKVWVREQPDWVASIAVVGQGEAAEAPRIEAYAGF